VPLNVLVTFPDQVDAAALELLRAAAPEVDVTVLAYAEPDERRAVRGRGDGATLPPTSLTDEQRAAFAAADVLMAFDVPIDVTTVAPNLRWVQAIGAGVDHLRDACVGTDLVVTNAVGVASVPIAEFVIARLLGVWKRFDELDDLQRRHEWQPAYGATVAGKTLGVIGLGAIGSAVAERARAFGMHLLGTKRSFSPGDTSPVVDELFGADQLLDVVARCDAVVLSAPSTPETRDLFDADVFAAMPAGSIFCNVARGAMVDEDALVAALERGHLRAAILDVTREEPLPADSPLWDAPNLHVSPHSAASIDRYIQTLLELFADNLGRHARGEPLRNVVDLAAGY
jgi:phosphoglycerate dehydrogenase-like enzyme